MHVRTIVRSSISNREINAIVIAFSLYLTFGLADAVCLERSQVTGSTPCSAAHEMIDLMYAL